MAAAIETQEEKRSKIKEQMKDDQALQHKKHNELKDKISSTNISEYSQQALQFNATMALADNDSDALADYTFDQIPHVAYLRTWCQILGLNHTLLFLTNDKSLTRAKDRKGRIEFLEGINSGRPVYYPQQIAPIPVEQTERGAQKKSAIKGFINFMKGGNGGKKAVKAYLYIVLL